MTGGPAKQTHDFLKSNGGKTKSNSIEVPSISLPKGGGSIKGIDEKFTVNAVNGSASFSVPLPFSKARGVTPALDLSYNSGIGNGVFGLGWSLSVSSIRRKTDKMLPKYFDSEESDIFLFFGAEDLVTAFKKESDGTFSKDTDGNYLVDEKNSADNLFTIRFYRPRVESLFARIEKWTEKKNGTIKWRVLTKDNVTTLLGWSEDTRISDPEDPRKVFEWLPEFVFDDKGNCARYTYKKEDATGFNASLLHNRNRFRAGEITYTNLYPESIFYGNKTPYKTFGDSFPSLNEFVFSAVFDYGEHDSDSPDKKTKGWEFRPDAFSDYRAGFEIRVTRLCKRILFFHHFRGPGEYDGLVRSLNLEYDTTADKDFTFLKSITYVGYIKKTDLSYAYKKLPGVEFEYQKPEWNKDVKIVPGDALIHSPAGLDEPKYMFTDLFNEGLSGILTEQVNGWYYKRNLGGGNFEHAKLVSPKPSLTGLGAQLQLVDLDADGTRQLVSFGTETRGYFELNDENEWQTFKSFNSLPNIEFDDPNTRMLDLDGDGKPEVMITADDVLIWYPSLGRNGYAAAEKICRVFDEEDGPKVVFADATQSIYLADMSGDGLTDIVRIRRSEICYWPNLGYGRFGQKISMDDSPAFDHPEDFNPAFIRLADIDGSGTSDIIYLGKSRFSCWKNLSGNSLSRTAFEIESFPEIHSQSSLTVADLLGNGVACIVWSSNLAKDAHSPLRYIDLMNGIKPHLMVSYKNNLGKEVRMEYTPSTKFYLEDKLAGKPWITKLHFPVHCISRMVTEDKISGYRFENSYKYHHGYYDHAEREFRGFGMVEQKDTETFEHWKKGSSSNITEQALHQEPVVSKNWYHTGGFIRNNKTLDQFVRDRWHEELTDAGYPVNHNEMEQAEARLILAPGIDPDTHISAVEWREALRACKGIQIRSEVFARDAAKSGNTQEALKKEGIPFSVTSHSCLVELVQPRGSNKHAVFVVKESEAISYHYERNPEDPRVTHSLNIKLDEWGNVLESASVVYPRSVADTSLPSETRSAQNNTVIIYTKNTLTNDVISADVFRLRLPCETKTYELKGVSKSGLYFTPKDFDDILSDARSDLAFYHETEKPLSGKAQKRLIEHTRSTYYRNNLTGALPLHQLEFMAIPFENFQLAFTPELLTNVFGTRTTATLLSEGKYTNNEGDSNWWVPSGTVQYISTGENQTNAQNRFYVPVSYKDPHGAITKVSYDASYSIFLKDTEDAFGNITRLEKFNFRMLAPQRMRDINANFSEVICDELGLVKALAIMGKGTQADDLDGLFETTENEVADIAAFYQTANSDGVCNSSDLQVTAKKLLKHASSRFIHDYDAYLAAGKPAVVASITRESHYRKTDGQLNTESKVQIGFEYSGGTGEILMRKVQAEPGKAKQVTMGVAPSSYSLSEPDTTPYLRWVGNGRAIRNNKGNVVKQYEPYFSVSPRFEDNKQLVESGVTMVMYYDASGRLIKTEMPDGTFSKVTFDSWKQSVFDTNDTVLDSLWYEQRTKNLIDDKLTTEGKDPAREKLAAEKAAKHAKTPIVQHFDTLGRTVLSVEHNKNIETGADEFYDTVLKLDAEGNLRTAIDARGNTVISYKYDMLGNVVYQKGMDAGQRWRLTNIFGKPLRTWDERHHEYRYHYDVLQRPTETRVINTIGDPGDAILDNIFDRIIYGENLLLPDQSNRLMLQGRNAMGKVVQHYDTGGVVDTPDYDFKGLPVAMTRKLFRKYKEVANWVNTNLANDLDPGNGFKFITETDALGRVTRQTTPDGSIIMPSYNEAGLLTMESVLHSGETAESIYIKDIDYNEKGLRNKIIYGNNVSIRFHYDKETFRLKRLESKRLNGDPLQDWYYTYDPVGNVTHIQDKNIPVVFFNNQKTEGVSTYTYDALYRLTGATGRENDAALTFGTCDNWNDAPFIHKINPGDSLAMRNYTQSYRYDPVGNITQMKHVATGGSWTRAYMYEATNNRLKSTNVGDNGNPANYTNYKHHPKHGYLEELPHLEKIAWNFKEEVIETTRQHCTDDGIPVITYYQYDGSGQRIRKITENQSTGGSVPTKKEERIYFEGFEVYTKHSGTHSGLQRTTLSLMDEGHRFVMIETRNGVNDGTDKKLVRYHLHNHLGSVSLELDGSANANVISYEEYHPFGTTAYQARNSAIQAAAKRYRYTGMERDDETGLEYHSARYYLPWLGRWLSVDPKGLVDGLNLYCATQNNPLNLKDPSGSESVGQLIERNALRAAGEADKEGTVGSYASGFLWSFADVTWSVFGAEGVSKVADDPSKATAGDYVSATIEVVSVVPVGKGVKALKGLVVAKEAAPVVTKEAAELVAKEVAPVVAKEAAPVVAKEVAPTVVKETTEAAEKAASKKAQKEAELLAFKELAKKEIKGAASYTTVNGLKMKSWVKGVLVGTSPEQFRRNALKIILNDPNHPLKKLLENKKFKEITGDLVDKMFDPRMVEAGHVISKFASGAKKEIIILMSAYENQLMSHMIESGRKALQMSSRTAVNIGGIAVSEQLAKDLLNAKIITQEVFDQAERFLF